MPPPGTGLTHTRRHPHETTTTDTWRIDSISGGSGTINHPVIAVAPGCPTERHPTRDCGCKVFRNRATAEKYIREREASS